MKQQRDEGRARIADVPVVLPCIAVTSNDNTDTYTVTVKHGLDGSGCRTGEVVPTAGLGAVIARYAEEAGTPVRVEIHDRDGAIHADIIEPPQPSNTGSDDDDVTIDGIPNFPTVVDETMVAGFLPGEQVLIAVVVQAVSADDYGRLELPLDPASPTVDASDQFVLVGATSRVAATRPVCR